MSSAVRAQFVRKGAWLVVALVLVTLLPPGMPPTLAQPLPVLGAVPGEDRVQGEGWPEGPVTLTIDDPDTPAIPDYTDTQQSQFNPRYGTLVEYDLGGTFDLQVGHEVTLSDGTTTKTHIVRALAVTCLDLSADAISGTAAPGSHIQVAAGPGAIGPTWRLVTAGPGGAWTADFSVLDDDPHEPPATRDLVSAPIDEGDYSKSDSGFALQVDEDGDYTSVGWFAPELAHLLTFIHDLLASEPDPGHMEQILTRRVKLAIWALDHGRDRLSILHLRVMIWLIEDRPAETLSPWTAYMLIQRTQEIIGQIQSMCQP
jgi:hypothetical protein